MSWTLWIFCGIALPTGGNSGLTIDGCRQFTKDVDVAEDRDVSLTCGTFWPYDYLTWDVHDTNNKKYYSGFCFYNGCSNGQNKFSLRLTGTWAGGYNSVLVIRGISRHSALRVRCSNTYQKEEECSLRITAYESYTDGSCSIRFVDWWVIGSCTVEEMYASDNKYTCSWTMRDNYQTFGGFGNTLKMYTANNSRKYARGVCSFKQPMPVNNSVITFTMTLSPGPEVYYNGTVDIGYPEGLKHNCPKQVFEGSNVSCVCFTNKRGTPPARITWDGQHNETLQLTDVRRGSQGVRFTCRLIWGPDGYINETTSYTLRVVRSNDSSESFSGWVIGGVVAAVIIVIIVAVISVYFFKRHKEPYAVVTKPKTQPPIARHTAPSGDLYTVASTTTAGHAIGEHTTVCKTVVNKVYGLDSNDELQATKATLHPKHSQIRHVKPHVKQKPAKASVKTFPNVSDAVYMNVAEVPTDSGLGVYHIVPWAVMSRETEPVTCEMSTPVVSEGQYDALHFENDGPPQGHQDDNYHHLQLQ